jgi:RNA ligase (TIGR02306 family)
MSDWHPCIVKLGKIDSLLGSDFLEITTVMGEFPCIFRKGEYKEEQLVSFLPYDSVVPDTEQWHFLAKPTKRDKDGTVLIPPPPVGQVPIKDRIVKARKIRGTYSEGLIVNAPPGFQEGDSIVEYFSLTKREYEEELPERSTGNQESAPKSFFLSKYDLEGLAKYGYAFQEGQQVIITEKIEGENCAIVYAEDRLWVRSRNWFKKDEPDSHWWDIPHRYNLPEKLKDFPRLVVFGELYGGVKGWKYDCPIINNRIQRKFRVFDIWDIKNKKFLEWDEVERITQAIGLETVPVLYKGAWTTDRSLHSLAEGKSTIGTCVREGFVVRSVPESWNEKLGRKILKLKGREYKLVKG